MVSKLDDPSSSISGYVVTRGKKLLTVAALLALGLILAWPFRKPTMDTNRDEPRTLPSTDIIRATNGDPIASFQPAKPMPEVASVHTQVAAQTASTSSMGVTPRAAGQLESFDLANHPALAGNVDSSKTVPFPLAEPAVSPPAYDKMPADSEGSIEKWPAELVHVVANGDTLEKLAERYLNDAGRALEIFDLNRDQLSNPHLLPIGVELRVPRNPDRIVD